MSVTPENRHTRDLPLKLRRPRLVLVLTVSVLAVMGILGNGVEDKLKPSLLQIPGSPSAQAEEMLQAHFGDSAPFAIMMRGPQNEIDRQGPELVAALRADGPKVTTLSPWDRGALAGLRPDPGTALIFADYHEPGDVAVDEKVSVMEESVAEATSPPVTASSSGFPKIGAAIQDESVSATERGELIAIPILLIVLLFVFRSPIAAAIPLLFGLSTVISARGVIGIFAGFADVDAFAVGVATMMGLALGVDYALLMVSRFREELEAGADPLEAASKTSRIAGRTVLFAGSTLFFAMLVSMFLLPGNLFVSMTGSVVIVTVISVFVARIAGPALLLELGHNVNRWPIGGQSQRETRWLGTVNRALRRPVPVTLAIGALMLALAAPAIGIRTGPPSVDQLPESDPTRQDAEEIKAVMGPGWSAPYILVATTDEGSLTEPDRLAQLATFQDRLAADPDVQAVIGPGEIAEQTKPLRQLEGALAGDGSRASDIARFQKAIDRAGSGVDQLRGGLAEARDGAAALHDGGGQAEQGARRLSGGLQKAKAGSARAGAALERFREGAEKIAKGGAQARGGAADLASGISTAEQELGTKAVPGARDLATGLRDGATQLGRLQEPADTANSELQAAWADLQAMSVGKTDPVYGDLALHLGTALAAVSGTNPQTGQPVDPAYDGLPAAIGEATAQLDAAADGADALAMGLQSLDEGLKKLVEGSAALSDGSAELRDGTGRLADGVTRFQSKADRLGDGITQLDQGAQSLAGGVSQLRSGAGELSAGLADGYERSAPLGDGLDKIGVRLSSSSEGTEDLRQNAPGLFDSGYFVLAALDGAQPDQRTRIAQGVDLEHGGSAAQLLVIPKDVEPGTPIPLDDRLKEETARFAEETGTETGITGASPGLTDFQTGAMDRIPLVVFCVTLLTYLVLVVVLRSLLLPAIAVFLNLLTVAAAFGAIALLFHVPSGVPFGGNEFISTIGAAGIFGVVFGLSIDYAVFLLMRMREHLEEHDDHEAAITFGLDKTAGVITGAAAIMAGVFTSFALAPIATVSQFGIGLTVAVILDATVVRLILLPALMRIFGRRVWWLPAPLERAIPRFEA